MSGLRYRLVSVVAVLLALAVGIVLGTSVLREPMPTNVQTTAGAVTNQNDRLQVEISALRQQVAADQQLTRNVTPALVDGKLAGERIVVVTAPGADAGLRKRVVAAVERAGATIDGRVSMTPKYVDEGEAGVISELASRLKPSGTKMRADSPYERSATVLAAGMMAGNADTGNRPPSAGPAPALPGFQTGGYIKTSGEPDGRASLALVIAPPDSTEAESPAPADQAILALARALDRRGDGAVVAGAVSAARQEGLIQQLRGSNAAKRISTVDFADTATGRVATVLALAEQASSTTGHYGVGPGADAYLPAMPSTP